MASQKESQYEQCKNLVREILEEGEFFDKDILEEAVENIASKLVDNWHKYYSKGKVPPSTPLREEIKGYLEEFDKQSVADKKEEKQKMPTRRTLAENEEVREKVMEDYRHLKRNLWWQTELNEILSVIESCKQESDAIKTKNFHLYSVSCPHKQGAMKTLIDFLLKRKLYKAEDHHVLEMKIPLDYARYAQRRDEFLVELGESFRVTKPRKRDNILPIFRGRIIKEIVYGKGKKMSMAFYNSLGQNRYLEFLYRGTPESGVKKVLSGLEKLL